MLVFVVFWLYHFSYALSAQSSAPRVWRVLLSHRLIFLFQPSLPSVAMSSYRASACVHVTLTQPLDTYAGAAGRKAARYRVAQRVAEDLMVEHIGKVMPLGMEK